MRVLAGALAATLVLTFGAAAQTAQPTAPAANIAAAAPAAAAPSTATPSQCARPPADPVIPDGATANRRAFGAAQDAVMAWSTAAEAISDCIVAEHTQANQQRQAKVEEHTQVNAHLRDVSQRWVTQRTAYCQRPRRQCSDRGAQAAAALHQPVTWPCDATITQTEPVIPDGATANEDSMNAAEQAYWSWGGQVVHFLDCRAAEVQHFTDIMVARQADAQALKARSDAVVGRWSVQLAAYCGRRGNQCNNTQQQQQQQ